VQLEADRHRCPYTSPQIKQFCNLSRSNISILSQSDNSQLSYLIGFKLSSIWDPFATFDFSGSVFSQSAVSGDPQCTSNRISTQAGNAWLRYIYDLANCSCLFFTWGESWPPFSKTGSNYYTQPNLGGHI